MPMKKSRLVVSQVKVKLIGKTCIKIGEFISVLGSMMNQDIKESEYFNLLQQQLNQLGVDLQRSISTKKLFIFCSIGAIVASVFTYLGSLYFFADRFVDRKEVTQLKQTTKQVISDFRQEVNALRKRIEIRSTKTQIPSSQKYDSEQKKSSKLSKIDEALPIETRLRLFGSVRGRNKRR